MKKRIIFFTTAICLSFLFVLVGCAGGGGYHIPLIDLSADKNSYGEKFNSLFEQYVVDDGSDYTAHPDTVLLKNGNLLTMYPEGHGKGSVIAKESADGGMTWGERREDTPKSWADSQETPTVYRLEFNNAPDKIVMISGYPRWSDDAPGDGFFASISDDEGQTWTEFEHFYGRDSEIYVEPIVAMASLTRLKNSDGAWRDAWMGFFHDRNFVNYKTILTFEDGQMKWSKPEPYFKQHRTAEKRARMCEVEVIRSEGGKGDKLCLLTRSNTKSENSMISFSTDEGMTWSKPQHLPSALNGERHKAEWLDDGRLFITFRSIERQGSKVRKYAQFGSHWYSEGWTAWVGTFSDLENSGEGQYRVKLAHTFLDGQTESQIPASADTGYCGNAVLPDGTVFTSTYGAFNKDLVYTNEKGEKKLKTYITAKRIDMKLLDELYSIIKK